VQSYTVYYDIAKEGYPYAYIVLLGIGLTAGFWGVIWSDRKSGGILSATHRWLPFARAFAAVCTICMGLATYIPYWAVRQSLLQGRYVLVEGTVRNFVPGDPGDHNDEEWDIISHGKTYHYQYSGAKLTPGFRQTLPHGGPIRQGLQVRIADVEGSIARLEIAQ